MPISLPRFLPLFLGTVLLSWMGACSNDNTPSNTNDKVPSSQQVVTPPPDMYKVVETFNVGNNIYVRSMAIDKTGARLWVGTSTGVIEVDANTRNLHRTYTRKEGLANEYVFGMMIDNIGRKWFGTNGGGASVYSDGQWKTYFPMHGLADYWVYSFTQQKNGSIWLGTWAGLSRFDSKTETFTNYVKELVNEWVYGLTVDSKDQVWIGTEGGINMFDGKQFHVWTHKDGLGAGNKENLPPSNNTGLGTRTRHDLTVTASGMPTYNPNYVFSLVAAKDDSIWAGTWGGGLSHYDGKAWRNFTMDDGLPGNIVYNVIEDELGQIWAGTNGGLGLYDGKKWMTFTTKDGLLDNNIYAIAAAGNGEIWVGSKNGVMLLAKAAQP